MLQTDTRGRSRCLAFTFEKLSCCLCGLALSALCASLSPQPFLLWSGNNLTDFVLIINTFVDQLNKNVNKTKSSQEEAFIASGRPSKKREYVNVWRLCRCICLNASLPLQHYTGQRSYSSSYQAGNIALAQW